MLILTPISVASSRGSPDGLKLSGAGTVCPTAYETLSGGNAIQYPYIYCTGREGMHYAVGT